MEPLNCEVKLANNKFISINVPAYENFTWTKSGEITDAEIWIIKTYYSLLKSRFVLLVMVNIL